MAKQGGKKAVTNENIMAVLRDVQEKVNAVDGTMAVQSKQMNRLQDEMSGFGSRLKRSETAIEKKISASEERLNEIEGAVKMVVEWGAMKADLNELATKHDLEQLKDEIIEPVTKAVDKDAEAIVDYGRRITVIERKVGIPAK